MNQHRAITRAGFKWQPRRAKMLGLALGLGIGLSLSVAMVLSGGMSGAASATQGTINQGTINQGTANQDTTRAQQAPTQPIATSEDMDFARSLSRAFAQAAKTIEPAVVHITTSTRVQQIVQDSLGRRFRGELFERQTGLGSGVIIDSDRGLIVTNNHVIEDGQRLLVRLFDGREIEADLVGADKATDLAVLRIEADGLSAAQFGDSDALSVGEWVLAVGSPFGFDQSVTAGIVSAKGRGLGSDTGMMRYEEFIQTDASINPGNSGGPLIDLSGRVIGINTAIISSVGQNSGLGFAIPSRLAQSVVDFIIEDGQVSRAFLGVNIEPLDPEQARLLDLPPATGAAINRVEPGGPADEAGLRTGDIVTAVDGRVVEGVGMAATQRLRNLIAFSTPGDRVEFTVLRGGQTVQVVVVMADRAEYLARRRVELLVSEAERIGGRADTELGIIVQALTPAIARQIGLPRNLGGEIVLYVSPESPAARANLQLRDVILEHNTMRLEGGHRHTSLEIIRNRRQIRIDIDLDANKDE